MTEAVIQQLTIQTELDQIETALAKPTLTIFDYFVVINSSLILTIALLNYIRLSKSPLTNVISYLSKEDIKQRQMVEGILKEMLGLSNAHRVVIGLFHNGTSVGSLHFQKMSVFYEALSPSASSLKMAFKDVEAYKLEQEVLKGSPDKFSKYSRQDPDLDPECKKYLDTQGLNTIYSRLLVSKKGVFGILEIQYVEDVELEVLHNNYVSRQLEQIFNKLRRALENVRKSRKTNL